MGVRVMPSEVHRTMDDKERWKPGKRIVQILKILAALVVGLVPLFLFANIIDIYEDPHDLNFYVRQASLSHFSVTTPNTTISSNMVMYNNISFNMQVNMSVINPSTLATADIKSIRAVARYKKRELSVVSMSPFRVKGYQRMNSFMEPAVFRGHIVVDRLQPTEMADYESEVKAGIHEMVVDLNLEIGVWYVRRSSSEVFRPPALRCDLRVPLVSSKGGQSIVPFNVTRCRGYSYVNADDNDQASKNLTQQTR